MDQSRPPIPTDDRAGQIALALSNPVRLRILRALAQRQMHVDEIAERVEQSRGNTSAQLRVLHECGLVDRQKQGRRVLYRIVGPEVEALVSLLLEVAWNPPDRTETVERIGPRRARDLLSRVRKGQLVLLDVRSEADFEAAHLPGARSLPLPDLRTLSGEELGLRHSIPIAVYCRGRSCESAVAAAALLRDQGYEVENLYTSVVELAAKGVQIEQSDRSPIAPVES